ncbi:MAG: chromosomal replication initiator protein DnaA [Calditrichaeota bacterium]|nr:chromosomal replication initiator protein DnaA [Calditrichota bacterium]
MPVNHVDIWSNILEIIRPKLNEQAFMTWFHPIKPINVLDNQLTVQVPSQFFYEFLESHYKEIIDAATVEEMGNGAKIIYSIVVDQNTSADVNQPPLKLPEKAQDKMSLYLNRLNERYTFDNFVEGSNNQFARAASLAVANDPGGTSFNPLVIYGGVGLGKTHLIQAIGNYLLRNTNGKTKRVLYISSEKFTIDFIDSIQNNKMTEFSNHYRNVDVLLVDDIQFLTNKERTQEEFFHTFNTIHQNKKQIVLTSDRPPKELKGIEERLISRFQWGLVTDIQAPDLETRIAILQKKAEENQLTLPKEIIHLFATNITTNIRELEGSLIRLLAASSLTGKDINVELAKNVLKDLRLVRKRQMSIEDIQRIVCDHYSIPEDLIRAKNRKKEIALARQIAMFLCKKYTNHSYITIGLHFGGRDHSTVIHAIKTVENFIKTNKKTKENVQALERKIELESI